MKGFATASWYEPIFAVVNSGAGGYLQIIFRIKQFQ